MVGWKDKIPGKASDSKEYFTVFTLATQQGLVNNLGQLKEDGYRIYLSLLGVIGKHSAYGAEPRKSYIWFEKVDTLKALELVDYDEVRYSYNLSNKGNIMLEVLARSLSNNGTPKL